MAEPQLCAPFAGQLFVFAETRLCTFTLLYVAETQPCALILVLQVIVDVHMSFMAETRLCTFTSLYVADSHLCALFWVL